MSLNSGGTRDLRLFGLSRQHLPTVFPSTTRFLRPRVCIRVPTSEPTRVRVYIPLVGPGPGLREGACGIVLHHNGEFGELSQHGQKAQRPQSACSPSYKDKTSGRLLEDVRLQHHRKKKNCVLHKWKIKAGKAMFVLKTIVEEDLFEHLWDAKTLKEGWDTFATLFSRANDARLQLMKSQLMKIRQGYLTTNNYFMKVKTLCHELLNLIPIQKLAKLEWGEL